MKKFNNVENEKVELPDGRTIWLSRSVAVVASVAVFKGGVAHFLIAKRGKGSADFSGLYNLPCGYLDMNETSYQAFLREVYEETGIDLEEIGKNEVGQYPWDIVTDPSENRQNVVIHHAFVGHIGKDDELPVPVIHNTVEDDEVEEVLWITEDQIGDFEYAFKHDKRLGKFIKWISML